MEAAIGPWWPRLYGLSSRLNLDGGAVLFELVDAVSDEERQIFSSRGKGNRYHKHDTQIRGIVEDPRSPGQALAQFGVDISMTYVGHDL